MTTNYVTDKSKQNINGFGLKFCDTIYSATLTTATDAYFTVPGVSGMGTPGQTINKFYAIITTTPGQDVFYCVNAATGTPAVVAAAPTGNQLNAATSALVSNGFIARMVNAGDIIHFISVFSSGKANVTVELYAITEG